MLPVPDSTTRAELFRWGAQILGGLVAFLVVLVIARFVRSLASRAMARENVRADVANLAARVIYVGLIALGVFLFVTIALGNALGAPEVPLLNRTCPHWRARVIFIEAKCD